jgi:hypothetical protein
MPACAILFDRGKKLPYISELCKTQIFSGSTELAAVYTELNGRRFAEVITNVSFQSKYNAGRL